MKYLILLALLASCGKHQMPAEKDLRDSDGDGVNNSIESDENKYIANVTPIENVEAELTFKTGISKTTTHILDLENKLDLNSYTMDLLVRNESVLPIEDYFSEFSILRIKELKKIDPNSITDHMAIHLDTKGITNTHLELKVIYHNGNITHLAKWQPTMDFTLSKYSLERIIAGDAHLALTRKTSSDVPNQTREQRIKEKSYRVFYNNGKKSVIYYVSKELSIERFLNHLSIDRTFSIENENLLTTTIKHTTPTWWIRKLNGGDIVVAKHNLRALSDHYFKGFEKKVLHLQRINGSSKAIYNVVVPQYGRALLKFKANKIVRTFKTTKKTESYDNSGGRDGSNGFSCNNTYRHIVTEKNVIPEDLSDTLEIFKFDKSLFEQLVMRNDDEGPIWELELKDSIELKMFNLPESTYFPVGLFKTTCGNERPILDYKMVNAEARIDLEIEAYVEKL